jgi:FlaA1/EpsC-like NDP-sugar epimerase
VVRPLGAVPFFQENRQKVLPHAIVRFRRPLIAAFHLVAVPVVFFTAFALRFDLPLPPEYVAAFTGTVILLLPIRVLTFAAFGLYRGWWRHVGMRDLANLLKAVSVSSALFIFALLLTQQTELLPRSILVLDWLLAVLVFGGARFCVRALRERSGWNGTERRGTSALVIGAGNAAERLLRQLMHDPTGVRPVVLVDDDESKHGMRLHGVPIVGTTEDLSTLVRQYEAKLIVIAIPSATRDQMKRIVSCCVETGVEFKIVPTLHELLAGRALVTNLRPVEVEDLLGRDTVELDLRAVRQELGGHVVLVTGGAGSIGSELARQVATFNPSLLVLVDQAESPLYFTTLELERMYPSLRLIPVVADIADTSRMEKVFRQYRPQYVFHAAAYKHVPLMEENVGEAVRNNVLATLNVAECSAAVGTKKFVMISTDKAVRPSSVMGATKRVSERIVLGWPSLRASATDFRAVRFGNVLGSDGSVVPLFKRQLEAGRGLTVTHPEVTRYFMTIPEAVQLVLQSASLSEAAGRIAMLHMGKPVRIVELAENLIRLSGLEPYADVPIVFTGLRPGEKLHEELVSDLEECMETSAEKITVIRTDEMDGVFIQQGVDRLVAALALDDADDLVCGLRHLVPECVAPLQDHPRTSFVEKQSA